MKCKICGSTMGVGAPDSEEIKIQYECWCGNVETENYTPEELEDRRAFENQVNSVPKLETANQASKVKTAGQGTYNDKWYMDL